MGDPQELFEQWREGPDGDMATPSLDDVLCEQMARAFAAGYAKGKAEVNDG